MGDAKTVHELQSIAEEAAREVAAAPPKRGLSRGAHLSLIDQLSRWGWSGLALIAGTTIFITVVIARETPLKSALWALLVLGALYLCRRYRKEYRRGDKIASHPFRWRAWYTSSLAAVSAAFGAGAFLLLPAASMRETIEIIALILAAAAGAAAFHAAHLRAAAAAGLPAFAATAGGAFSAAGLSAFSLIVFGAGMAAATIIFFAAAELERRAAARYPRTSIVRREADRRPAARAAPIAESRAAAN